VLCVPAIRFAPAEDLRPWRAALGRRRLFTHLVFTSQMAARVFADLSLASGVSLDEWRPCRVAAIGARTGEVLTAAGLPPDFVAAGSRGLDFATALVEQEGLGPGCLVLLPQSAIARPEVADLLEAAGAAVEAVAIYETIAEDESKAEALYEALDAGDRLDAVVFASPSAARCFLEMTGDRGRRLLARSAVRLVAIGPTTAEALASLGLPADAVARTPDNEGILAALAEALSAEG
jgi:uroporphyrinogen-III synthase